MTSFRGPRVGLPALLAALALSACGPVATAGPGCATVRSPMALPDALGEASGVAVSLRHPGVFWMHNDADSPLFAVDAEGRELARFRLPVPLRDWEDVAVASCSDGGSCLWAADVGDNYEERDDAKLVRFPEPDPDAGVDTLPAAEVFPVAYPDGPRDVEALVVLPGERVLLITKGRDDPVTVYRYPPPLRPGERVTLEEVQRLSERSRILPRQLTGGASDPSGLVALRTYEALRFYRMDGDTLASLDDGTVNLRTLSERQGEGVGLGLDGQVVLTSEAGPGGGRGSMALLRCSGLE